MSALLTVSQAATLAHTSDRSVRRWIAAGQLPAIRIGGTWRVTHTALTDFITRSTVAAEQRFAQWPPPMETR